MGKLIERSIPNLFGGVSRQPATVRKENQHEVQDNSISSIADGGWEKRPCTQLIASLAGVDNSVDYFTHFIDRSSTEQSLLLISSGSILAYNAITGAAKTVTVGDTKHYHVVEADGIDSTGVLEISGVDFEEQLGIDSSETTFDWGWQLSDATTGRFRVEGSADGAVWNTIAGGTPIGGAASGTFNTTIDAVASGDHNYIRVFITTGMATAADTLTLWATFKDLTYLIVSGPEDLAAVSIADHTFIVNKNVTCRMAEADVGTVAANARSTAVGTPPAGIPAPDGEAGIYKIIEDDNVYTTFYVEDDATDNLYKEVADPNAHNEFDASTLPHELTRNADGTFTYAAATWTARGVGDETLTPPPPFIGEEIQDISFFRNRLTVISDESEFCGRVGLPYNWWPEKATEQLPGDPVERAATTKDINILRFLESFRKTLFSTSDRAQFELSSDGNFEPTKALFDQTTRYPASVLARPVAMGDVLYFPSQTASAASVYEYYFDDTSLNNTAAEITKHADRYIPTDILQMAADTQTGTLFVLTTGEQNSLYVYRTYFAGNEKLMSSWSRYTFGAAEANAYIHGIGVLSGYLVMVIERDDGNIYLEQMSVDPEEFDTTMGYIPLIDQREIITGTYDSTYDYTYWEPTWNHNDDVEVCMGPNDTVPGNILQLYYPDQYILTLATVLAGETITIDGLEYTAHASATTTANREFDISGNDAADAGELVTCINDATDGSTAVTAVDNSDGTITLTIDDPINDTLAAPTGTAVDNATITVTELNNRVAARTDHSGASAYVGRTYTSTVEFSKFYMRDRDSSVILNGRLQVRDLTLNYKETGYFVVRITPKSRDAVEYKFAGRVLGDEDNTIGAVAIDDIGTFRVPVLSRGDEVKIEVVNDSPVPNKIISAAWRGFFNEISRQG